MLIKRSDFILLLEISEKSRKIAYEIVPLIETLPLEDTGTFQIVHNLYDLMDGIVFSENITLLQLAQNIFEFLDNLRAISFKMLQYRIMTKKKFEKTTELLDYMISKTSIICPFSDKTTYPTKIDKKKFRRGLDGAKNRNA